MTFNFIDNIFHCLDTQKVLTIYTVTWQFVRN